MTAIRRVPWYSSLEWLEVYNGIFSGGPELKQAALRRISLWEQKSPRVPVAVSCTKILLEALQADTEGSGLRSPSELQMLYGMAIIRFVNCHVDLQQQKKYAQPIASAARELGIPAEIVNCRHRLAHNDMPSLDLLRHTAKICWEYLELQYWKPQANMIKSRIESMNNSKNLASGLIALLQDLEVMAPPNNLESNLQHLAEQFNITNKAITSRTLLLTAASVAGLRQKDMLRILKKSKLLELGTHPTFLEAVSWCSTIAELLPKCLNFIETILHTCPQEDLTLSFLKDLVVVVLDPEINCAGVICVFWILSRESPNFTLKLLSRLMQSLMAYDDEDHLGGKAYIDRSLTFSDSVVDDRNINSDPYHRSITLEPSSSSSSSSFASTGASSSLYGASYSPVSSSPSLSQRQQYQNVQKDHSLHHSHDDNFPMASVSAPPSISPFNMLMSQEKLILNQQEQPASSACFDRECFSLWLHAMDVDPTHEAQLKEDLEQLGYHDRLLAWLRCLLLLPTTIASLQHGDHHHYDFDTDNVFLPNVIEVVLYLFCKPRIDATLSAYSQQKNNNLYTSLPAFHNNPFYSTGDGFSRQLLYNISHVQSRILSACKAMLRDVGIMIFKILIAKIHPATPNQIYCLEKLLHTFNEADIRAPNTATTRLMQWFNLRLCNVPRGFNKRQCIDRFFMNHQHRNRMQDTTVTLKEELHSILSSLRQGSLNLDNDESGNILPRIEQFHRHIMTQQSQNVNDDDNEADSDNNNNNNDDVSELCTQTIPWTNPGTLLKTTLVLQNEMNNNVRCTEARTSSSSSSCSPFPMNNELLLLSVSLDPVELFPQTSMGGDETPHDVLMTFVNNEDENKSHNNNNTTSTKVHVEEGEEEEEEPVSENTQFTRKRKFSAQNTLIRNITDTKRSRLEISVPNRERRVVPRALQLLEEDIMLRQQQQQQHLSFGEVINNNSNNSNMETLVNQIASIQAQFQESVVVGQF